MTPSGKFDDGRYAEALDYVLAHEIRGESGGGRVAERGRKQPPFRSRFHCSTARDDRVEKARERREYVVYPYSNPLPFDHRGVRRGREGRKGRDNRREVREGGREGEGEGGMEGGEEVKGRRVLSALFFSFCSWM